MSLRCPSCGNLDTFVAVLAEWADYACTSEGVLQEFLGGEIHGVTEYRCLVCYAKAEGRVRPPSPRSASLLHPRSSHE